MKNDTLNYLMKKSRFFYYKLKKTFYYSININLFYN